jgi:nitrogenase molybdenum-iron protein alpha/beta subunit
MGAVLAISGIKGAYIVYHGVPGCNTIVTHVRTDMAPLGSYTNMILTGVNHDNLIMGTSVERLRQALKFVKATMKKTPPLLAIVNADAIALVGDDIVGQAKLFEQETGIPALAIDMPGMKGWDIVGYDTVFQKLLSRFARKEKATTNTEKVNLIAPYLLSSQNWIFDLEAIKKILNRMGIQINCVLTRNTTIDEIKNFSSASINIMLTSEDMPLFQKESELLGVPSFGQDLPLPYGIINSEDWCIAIAEKMGKIDQARKMLEEDALFVKRILGLNYSFTWESNLLMQKRACVIGRAQFAASLARMLYYDFDAYPLVVALQAATPGCIRRSRALLDSIIKDGIEMMILDNPTYMEIARAIKEMEIDFVLGTRIEKPLIEGMRIPHLSIGSAYHFQSFRFIPYPYVGYEGSLYLTQELGLVMEEMFQEKDKWRALLFKGI